MPSIHQHAARKVDATSVNDPVKALAIFATLQAIFSDTHSFCDQIVQSSHDAQHKGDNGWPGRKACASHVASYSAVQLAVTFGVTRVLKCKVPWGGLLAGTAVNAVTHYFIDRREPLQKFLRSKWVGKTDYLDHATVQRRDGVIDQYGPGTAIMEMDEATHRMIGIFASLTTTWLVIRSNKKRRTL